MIYILSTQHVDINLDISRIKLKIHVDINHACNTLILHRTFVNVLPGGAL